MHSCGRTCCSLWATVHGWCVCNAQNGHTPLCDPTSSSLCPSFPPFFLFPSFLSPSLPPSLPFCPCIISLCRRRPLACPKPMTMNLCAHSSTIPEVAKQKTLSRFDWIACGCHMLVMLWSCDCHMLVMLWSCDCHMITSARYPCS